ncbi:MAG: class I SAM-dependent methyltransferase [Pyrinomonadaceae bacterium]
MSDTVERFSNRVENYVKYRPNYPADVLALLSRECGLTKDTIVADIGCGPGTSTRIFLENGNRVFGVEPNDAMRGAAIKQLEKFPWFIAVGGTAESTTLGDASVNMVVAAQAFHWFDPERTRAEFKRVLTPGGYIVLIWNERQLDTTPFLVEYEALLLKYANDYGNVRHENIDTLELTEFFQKGYDSAAFDNVQIFDFEALKGRLLSASYMPTEESEVYESMVEELRALFAKHNENGRIKVFYDTKVYYSQV